MTESYQRFKDNLARVGRKPPCENPEHVMNNYQCMTCGKKSFDYVTYTPPITMNLEQMDTAPRDGTVISIIERREIRWKKYEHHHVSKGPVRGRGDGRWVIKFGEGWVKYNGNPLGWFKK